MWRINRDIQYQGWQLHFFFVFDSYSIAHISNYLQLLKADEHIIERAEKSMRDNKPNTAFTFCSRTKREAIIAIGRTTNGAEFINSFSHELRHVADNIGKEKGITDDESIAYMTGDISEQLSDVVCLLACDKCRTKYGLKTRNAINANKYT